ncbi:MAG: hypothetical protein IT165_28310 [Bryobacterales bacterium]|nr:hypothetical protein [Bryobacterales bacterium]
MQISKALLHDYLSHVTVAYFARHHTPPEDMEDYGPAIGDIRRRAQREGRADEFRVALDFMKAHPEIQPREFLTLTFPYSNQQLHELMAYIREYLYPFDDPTPPEDLEGAELV